VISEKLKRRVFAQRKELDVPGAQPAAGPDDDGAGVLVDHTGAKPLRAASRRSLLLGTGLT
jgi:hypothetical protein